MHLACQAQCAWHSVARITEAKLDFRMPPVPKPKHQRQPHYMRQWRKHAKLSQEAAAERVGIDRATLSKIEAGKVPYNQDLVERLAFAYGCEPSDIIAVNPAAWDGPRLVFERLRHAPRETQERAIAILDALLKAG